MHDNVALVYTSGFMWLDSNWKLTYKSECLTKKKMSPVTTDTGSTWGQSPGGVLRGLRKSSSGPGRPHEEHGLTGSWQSVLCRLLLCRKWRIHFVVCRHEARRAAVSLPPLQSSRPGLCQKLLSLAGRGRGRGRGSVRSDPPGGPALSVRHHRRQPGLGGEVHVPVKVGVCNIQAAVSLSSLNLNPVNVM